MINEKNILAYVSAYYLFLQIPAFSKVHKQLCGKLGINWELDLSFTQYMNFLMPFLGFVGFMKLFTKNPEGNSQAFSDKWSIGHFSCGVLAQHFTKNSDKSLLLHLIFEIYEKTERFWVARQFLPLSIRQLFELEGYEEGDSLENLCGDFFYFYAGVLLYNKIFLLKV